MEAITLAVSRTAGGAGYAVQFYRWRNGACAEKPSAEADLPAGLFAAGGCLDVAACRQFFLETAGEDPGFRGLGEKLWAALHTGEVGAAWDAAIREVEDARYKRQSLRPDETAAGPEPGLRTYLQIDEDLAALPWELLRAGHDLFLEAGMPFLRAGKREFLPRADAAVWPVRVLVVVGASAAEAPILKADEELAAIRDVFRRSDYLFDLKILETRRCETFTPADLRAELQSFRPHIFHFIGHGRTDEGSPRLEICDRRSKQDWSSSQIELDVRNMGGVLRLAFLNACRTSERHSSAASIAQAFFRGRALAVLAMQADVSGSAAATCTRAFYCALVNQKPVDVALAAARHAVYKPERRDAFVPVLTVNAAPAHILACPPRRPVIAPGLDEVRRFFVDRIDERRVVLHSMARSEILNRHCSAVVLRGQEEKIGKTWLQMWLLHALAQRNYSIHAVDAFDKSDWLQFVLALCEGAPEADAFAQPLPAAMRRRFYEDLARLSGKPAPAENIRPDFTLADFASRNDAHVRVLGAFHEALRVQAEQNPAQAIVLAIGRISTPLESLSAAHVKTLKDHLWDRIAADPAGRVKIIVELPFDSRGEYAFEFAEDLWKTIDLQKFSAAMVPELLKEFFFRRNPNRPLPALAVHVQQVNRDIRPDELPKLVTLLEALD